MVEAPKSPRVNKKIRPPLSDVTPIAHAVLAVQCRRKKHADIKQLNLL